MPDRPLGRIVVPWDTILFKETEQRFAVPHKAFLVFLRHIQGVLSALNDRCVEPGHLLLDSTELFRLQSPPVDGLDHGYYEILHCCHELLKFLIIWKVP